MSLIDFIKGELKGWGRIEKFIFPLVIMFIFIISIYMKDNTFALISAICGVCATITAGKGKISCYIFGMVSNICYSYISLKNAFWGNLCLNMLYYFPMQFVGIAKWKNHLKKDTHSIYKTRLTQKQRMAYIAVSILLSVILYYILLELKDKNPLIDSTTTVLSVVAFILTIKRCIEQWYVWTIVNGLCVLMWIGAYVNGSHCFATILMWSTYFVLGLYFWAQWDRELDT